MSKVATFEFNTDHPPGTIMKCLISLGFDAQVIQIPMSEGKKKKRPQEPSALNQKRYLLYLAEHDYRGKKEDSDTHKKFNRIRHNFAYRKLLNTIEREALEQGVAIRRVNPAYTSVIGKYKYAEAKGLSVHQAAALVCARRGLGFRERVPRQIQQLIPQMVSHITKQLPAMEAKAKREVKRLLRKLDSWNLVHSWSFWHTFKTLLRKVGVYAWFCRDLRLAYGIS